MPAMLAISAAQGPAQFTMIGVETVPRVVSISNAAFLRRLTADAGKGLEPQGTQGDTGETPIDSTCACFQRAAPWSVAQVMKPIMAL